MVHRHELLLQYWRRNEAIASSQRKLSASLMLYIPDISQTASTKGHSYTCKSAISLLNLMEDAAFVYKQIK